MSFTDGRVTLTRRRILQSAAQLGAALAAGSAWADPLPSRICTANPLRKVVMRQPEAAPPSMLHPDRLAPFVDALPIPKTARTQETATDPDHPTRKIALYRIAMREAQVRIHRDLPPTRMWGYDGMVPGPTFDVRAGQPLLIEWANDRPSLAWRRRQRPGVASGGSCSWGARASGGRRVSRQLVYARQQANLSVS